MDNFYLTAIVRELSEQLEGRDVASVNVGPVELRVNLKLARRRILFISLDRSWPGVYISSKSPQKVKSESNVSAFGALLKEQLTGARIKSVGKPAEDRVVRLEFESGKRATSTTNVALELNLRGQSSNAFLYDYQRGLLGSMYSPERVRNPKVKRSAESAKDETFDARPNSSYISDVTIALEGRHLTPALRAELAARAEGRSTDEALESLIFDLEERQPEPSVFSQLPIEEAGRRLFDLRKGLVLSHIDLESAKGMLRYRFGTLSEAAEAYWEAYNLSRRFNEEFRKLRKALNQEIDKQTEIVHALEKDRARFEDPARFRRAGELLLANVGSARVSGNVATVVDYFDPAQPKTEIELPAGATVQQAAADYFSRYQKANRALAAIESRSKEIGSTLNVLTSELKRLDEEPTETRVAEVRSAARRMGLGSSRAGRLSETAVRKRARGDAIPGRRFRSSDGYEVIVGRNDRENDTITFRVARSGDIWLHAADYPGSHVVVRNHLRSEVPHRTVTEAAELAALNSQAKRAPKVAVHYTLRKFVSKPPKAKPGLVRLSSFKTLMVEPRCRLEKLE
jgi:predicted ribosome quality control (RQC) complex YloA/Tae2 family protein